jgi:hypothetical protein
MARQPWRGGFRKLQAFAIGAEVDTQVVKIQTEGSDPCFTLKLPAQYREARIMIEYLMPEELFVG